ncbi:Ca-activated chloride channel family protein [Tistlia consotensis]|uniref:Ca-activated chloride channel family protein n=1 Tax=Tistlia consotensis USBA 355 TaxID=560819 RepID=A0A1Y6C8T9_9PROT|nr:VWA domain-containing protein [Tistlia consotensis]SMF51860.1 Ca-activated chloride channel family protein [Tistlia consotensis USBA 355]SNR83673.1 Ca-activated chloride channel family protein [Tistlia consotensis]
MIELGGIALLRPAWLLALPAVALLALLSARRAGLLGGWDRAVDPALMAALRRLGRVVPGRGGHDWLPAVAAALIALALSGPARETRDAPAFRNLDGIVLVLDLSRSVAESGYLPEALAAARLVAERSGARPLALVVYAGDAYLASAFTTDAEALGTTIAVLDGATVPDAGSRPDRALALAGRTLRQADIVAGDVVLVTDGGGLDEAARQEVGKIVAAGGRVSTLFVPPAPDPAGGPLPDRRQLDALAALGEGLGGSVDHPLELAEALGGEQASRIAQNDLSALFWRDWGRYLLLAALLPALALFRRRA